MICRLLNIGLFVIIANLQSVLFSQDIYQGQDPEGYELRKALGLEMSLEQDRKFPAQDGWSWQQREKEYGFRVFGLEKNRFYGVTFSEVLPDKLSSTSHLMESYSSLTLRGERYNELAMTSDEIHRWLAKLASDFREENMRVSAYAIDKSTRDANKRPFPTKSIVIVFEYRSE